jgi:glycolate oxidase FAD binding subunit
MTSATLNETAASLVGVGATREGSAGDAVDGVVPRIVVEPSTVEQTGAVVQWASRDKLAMLVRGAGTKLDWGAVPDRIDLVLSTARLNAVVAHRHGDLTATVQSGATLAGANQALAAHRQWIPLDPPFISSATIGGIVATNDSGPRRHRYGVPRDLIIGVEFLRTDGLMAKGGGIVVKNVAGYDLPRLLTGSFGTLGVIVTATFKLYPLTAGSRTLIVELPKASDLGALTATFLASHLTPTSLEFATHPLKMMIRFESIDVSVAQQAEHAMKLVAERGFAAEALTGQDEADLWDGYDFFDSADGALVKVSTLPSDLARTLDEIERLAAGAIYHAAGRAGAGVFLLHIPGDVSLQKRIVEGLRGILLPGRGSAVVIRAPRELKAQLDVWGPLGDGLGLMKAVKQQFDPAGVLGPGRGPGGI